MRPISTSNFAVPLERGGIVGIEFDRPAIHRSRRVDLPAIVAISPGGPRLGRAPGRASVRSAAAFSASSVRAGRCAAVADLQASESASPDLGQRELGIEFDRLAEELLRFDERLAGALGHALLAELVGLPGLEVPRRHGVDPRLFAGVKAAFSAPAIAAATSLWMAKMFSAVSSRS